VPTIPWGSVTEICYVTTDLTRAIECWAQDLGAGPFFTITIPADFGTRTYRGRPAEDSFTAALGFCGSTLVEFVQPLNDRPSVFREVLDTHGDLAIHHVYPNIRPVTAAEFDRTRARYEQAGYPAALDMFLPGLGRNILFDARARLGVFVELLEVSPPMYAGVERMLSAHQSWDGSRSIRDFAETMIDRGAVV
jgi:Glyoxalase/Bleomycin resistance protein/Dioxygenase superfamily